MYYANGCDNFAEFELDYIIFCQKDVPHNSNPDEIMDRIDANETTRNLVNSLNSKKDQFIALMCSPELMGLENA